MTVAGKFPHNPKFDPQLEQIPDIVWYPYVGQHFDQHPQKLMVFAHNAYMDAATYAVRKADFEQKSVWADCVEEYTYEQGWWTNAFRYFVKGAVGLKENYGYFSSTQVIDSVDAFVNRIAYINFIQGLVISDRALTGAEGDKVALRDRKSVV